MKTKKVDTLSEVIYKGIDQYEEETGEFITNSQRLAIKINHEVTAYLADLISDAIDEVDTTDKKMAMFIVWDRILGG